MYTKIFRIIRCMIPSINNQIYVPHRFGTNCTAGTRTWKTLTFKMEYHHHKKLHLSIGVSTVINAFIQYEHFYNKCYKQTSVQLGMSNKSTTKTLPLGGFCGIKLLLHWRSGHQFVSVNLRSIHCIEYLFFKSTLYLYPTLN